MMNKRANRLLGAASAIMAFANSAHLVSAQVMPSAGLQQISGKILLVDSAKNIVKLEVEKHFGTTLMLQPIEFVLSAKTAISEGTQKLQPTDLRSGTKVQIEYQVEAGKNVAQTINVQKPTEADTSENPEGAQAPSQGPERSQPKLPPSR